MSQEQVWHSALSSGQIRAGPSVKPPGLAQGRCGHSWRSSSSSWHPAVSMEGGPQPGSDPASSASQRREVSVLRVSGSLSDTTCPGVDLRIWGWGAIQVKDLAQVCHVLGFGRARENTAS